MPVPLRLREHKPQRCTFSSFQSADQYLERSVKRLIYLMDIGSAYPSAAVRITGLGDFFSGIGVSVDGLE